MNTLCLDHMQLGVPAVARLAASRTLRNLRHLALVNNPLETTGVEALTRADWPGLRRLNLSFVSLGRAELSSLLDWPALATLRSLSLHCTQLDVSLLARARSLGELVDLDLGQNRMHDAGFVTLARSAAFPKLRSLNLEYCCIGGPGLQLLLDSWAHPDLERLRLSDNPIGDEGARCLLESPSLGKLTWLDVNHCGMSERMFAALKERFLHVGPW